MSNIRPIVAASLSSEAFDKVVEAVVSGEFDLGERLSEADLARRLGISRGPPRQALGRLEGRLVRRTPRIGVHVIEFSRDDIEAPEGMATRLACERMSEDKLIVDALEGRDPDAGEPAMRTHLRNARISVMAAGFADDGDKAAD